MKALEKGNKSIIDVNMDLNELFREIFGEPIIDIGEYRIVYKLSDGEKNHVKSRPAAFNAFLDKKR